MPPVGFEPALYSFVLSRVRTGRGACDEKSPCQTSFQGFLAPIVARNDIFQADDYGNLTGRTFDISVKPLMDLYQTGSMDVLEFQPIEVEISSTAVIEQPSIDRQDSRVWSLLVGYQFGQ
jgi:hypothetical protein